MNPSESEVVETATQAAHDVIFSRYDRSEVRDLEVIAQFEEGIFEVEVLVDAPGDADQVADDAALAAQSAVDRLFKNNS